MFIEVSLVIYFHNFLFESSMTEVINSPNQTKMGFVWFWPPNLFGAYLSVFWPEANFDSFVRCFVAVCPSESLAKVEAGR